MKILIIICKTVCWGKRHTFVLLAFLGTANAYAMRINLSVAIVGMVKPSGKQLKS